MKVTVTTGLSTTKKSAESKKCNSLKAISLEVSKEKRVKMGKILKAVCGMDALLRSVLTDAEIDRVVETGERPGRGKSGGLSVTIDI